MIPKVGDIAQGIVVRVYSNYAIMLFDGGWSALLHISELSSRYVRNFAGYVRLGNIYTVKVIEVSEDGKNNKVSLKQMSFQEKKEALKPMSLQGLEVSPKALLKKLPTWIEEELKGA